MSATTDIQINKDVDQVQEIDKIQAARTFIGQTVANNIQRLRTCIVRNGLNTNFSDNELSGLSSFIADFMYETVQLNKEFSFRNQNTIATLSNMIFGFLIWGIETEYINEAGVIELIIQNLEPLEDMDDKFFKVTGLGEPYQTNFQDIDSIEKQNAVLDGMFFYYLPDVSDQIARFIATIRLEFTLRMLERSRKYSEDQEKYWVLCQESLSELNKFLYKFMHFMRFLTIMPKQDDSEIIQGLGKRINYDALIRFPDNEKNRIDGIESTIEAKNNARDEMNRTFDYFKYRVEPNADEVRAIDMFRVRFVTHFLSAQYNGNNLIHPGKFWWHIDHVVTKLNDSLNSYQRYRGTLVDYINNLKIEDFNYAEQPVGYYGQPSQQEA